MAVSKGQLIFHGYHTYNGKHDVVEPATYSVMIPALANDGTASDDFQVDAGYDFHVLEMTHVVAGVAQGGHVPLVIQIKPQNERDWFIKPVYINAVSALQDAGTPRKLPTKRVLPSQKTVSVLFYDATSL